MLNVWTMYPSFITRSLSGHSTSVLMRLEEEIERLEEIKKANIEKFVITLRDELHSLWDDCYFSEQQRSVSALGWGGGG